MKEYSIRYQFKGVEDNYFVTVSKVKLPFILLRFSIVNQLKSHLNFKPGDKLKIIGIERIR